MSRFADVEAGFAWIESFLAVDRGAYQPRRHRLARMRRFLAAAGDPQLAYRTVHVAGSKGKGSTAVLIASALDAAGLRCGLYTSPHVESYRERVRVLDGSLTDALMLAAFDELASLVESLATSVPAAEMPTTFEALTMLGFLVFRAARCDVAVIEVGIGGRADATNVLRPSATVINRIELEHTELLGSTLRAIAAEKSGIIRAGVPVYVGSQAAEAMATIERVASLRRAPVRRTDELVTLDSVRTGTTGTRLCLRVTGRGSVRTTLRLVGDVQAQNAALAALVVSELEPRIDDETIASGFARAFLPGRSELFPGSPALLLDGAHTERSIALLARTAASICPDRNRRVVIFGSVLGKNHEPMLRELVRAFRRVVVARPGTFKASDPGALYRLGASLGGDVIREDEFADALGAAHDALGERAPGDPTGGLIVIAGSFYLVGEARAHLRATDRAGGADHE